MKKLMLLTVLFFGCLLCALQASAQEKNFIAPMIGNAFITSEGGGNRLAWSLRVGGGVLQDESGILSLGVFVGGAGDNQRIQGVDVDGHVTLVGTEILCRKAFGSWVYYGGRFGLGITSLSFSAGGTSLSGSGTSFAFAPVVGYEAPISARSDLIIDLSYLTIGGGNMSILGTSVNYNATQALTLSGGVSFKF